MQQAVLDALGKEPDWVPIPREIIDDIRQQLHDGLTDIASRLTPENALWVSKHKLTTVHGCEANHLAGLHGFEWTLGNVKGTVLMCTFGTGIGTAIFVDGKLVPNTELG